MSKERTFGQKLAVSTIVVALVLTLAFVLYDSMEFVEHCKCCPSGECEGCNCEVVGNFKKDGVCLGCTADWCVSDTCPCPSIFKPKEPEPI